MRTRSGRRNAKELIEEFFKQRKKEDAASAPPKSRAPRQSKVGTTPSAKAHASSPPSSATMTKRGNVSAKRGQTTRSKKSVSASISDREEEAPRASKKPRLSASANGAASKKSGSLSALNNTNTDNDGFDDAEVEEDEKILYKSMKEPNLSSEKNWERHVKEVKTVERVGDELMVYFET